MLHFSCNLGILTLSLPSPNPCGHPLPKSPGVALKQPLETTDLQDHLPVRVYVRFVDGFGVQIDLVLLGREDLYGSGALAL